MYRVAVHNLINHIIAIFQCFGFWDATDGTESAFGKRVEKFSHFLFYSSIVISVGAFKTNDKEESIYLTAVVISLAVQVAKLFYIIWRSGEVLTFIHNVDSVIIKGRDEYNQINNKVENLMKFAKYFGLMCIITVVLASVFYVVEGEKNLPLNIGFHLDLKNSEIGYWTAFTYFVVEAIYSFAIMSFNIIIWYLMLNFKYQLLGNQLRCRRHRINEERFPIRYNMKLILFSCDQVNKPVWILLLKLIFYSNSY